MAQRPKHPRQPPVDEPLSKPLRIAFGRQFRIARFDKRLTMVNISAETGIHRTHISLIERGEQNVTFETAVALARAVGFSIDLVWNPILPDDSPKK